jgi:hydrogenase expression/formation protein HypC
MCLAIPSKIVWREDLRAMVEVYGARKEINLMLMGDEAGVGDYVLVHAGFAIQKVEREAAEDSLRVISSLIEEMEGESCHPPDGAFG